ncbi:MAG: hypothetical protein V4520_18535 [Bacteroidota bacterium]
MPTSIIIQEPHSAANIFRQLRPHDSNLLGELSASGSNFTKTRNYCIRGLDSAIPIVNLLDLTMPLDLNDVQWDFELGQGSRSLARRGFYKIIGTPTEVIIGTIPTWCASVLYHPHSDSETIFKFFSRIGPLLNQQALGFDFSPAGPSYIRGIHPNLKRGYFESMLNQTFYVSQQRRVTQHGHAFYDPKETVWFKFV